jgi:ferric-dicitrate binding protein FerR (iron transport regulator)
MTKPDDDYLWDRRGADPEVERLEKLLAPLAHTAPLDELRLRRPRSRMITLLGIATAVAATLALVVWWRWPRELERYDGVACAGFGFVFNGRGGEVKCNGVDLAVGVVPLTGTLDTGAREAELAIADIGTAQLGAQTRVRLDHSQFGKRHQLHLEHGRMHAKVDAVPKVFAVTTPSADVTDLGCEYTLELDKAGAGSIHVVTGKVELETGNGAVVMAPAGTRARLLPGRRASIPISDRASPKLASAIAGFEAGQPDALRQVLELATVVDAITVANLAKVVPVAHKRTVLETLAKLVCPPQDLTIDEALSDQALFEMWFDEVYLVHIGASTPSCRPKP